MVTITVSKEIRDKLLDRGFKSESYNDVIGRLISVYEDLDLEDFTDEEAEYYNKCIDEFEKGNFDGSVEVNLDDIREKYGSD